MTRHSRYYSDSVTRPKGALRVEVDVKHRLSHDEVHRAFLFYASELLEFVPPVGTPTIERLCDILITVLLMKGHSILWDQNQPKDGLPWLFADRCTRRLWSSARVKEKGAV